MTIEEYVNDNEISKVLDNLITNNPQLADYIKMPNDIPYFLNYIQLIKKYNPKIWPRFLTMLYKTKDETIKATNLKTAKELTPKLLIVDKTPAQNTIGSNAFTKYNVLCRSLAINMKLVG